jgi:hypothetical protein
MALRDPHPPLAETGAPHLGEQAAEAIRGLNHLTRRSDAFTDPAELSWLLADLAAMADRLPQLFGQLHSWLSQQHRAAPLRADTDADPGVLVASTAAQLTRAQRCAEQLAGALHTAHQHVAHLATA